MEYVKFKCCRGELKQPGNCNIPEVTEFDAWENFDLFNQFFAIMTQLLHAQEKNILRMLTKSFGSTM